MKEDQRLWFTHVNVHGPQTSVCVVCQAVVHGMPNGSESLEAHLLWHRALTEAVRGPND